MFRFLGRLKELVTEKSEDSVAASTRPLSIGSAQRRTATQKADRTSSKLEDIGNSRERTGVDESDMTKVLDDELDIGELFS